MDKVIYGSIQEAVTETYDTLLTTGSSVLDTEVLKAVINAAKKYHTWSGQLAATNGDNKLVIDADTMLAVDDWEIIEPVVLAHCSFIQARRLEAMQELGAGMSASECTQLYREAVELMKREAFQFPPMSIDLDSDLSTLD
ncbi:hypothetical protein [Psychrobacter aestuarii]|uniref:Uncharacterized protein n=1 Tax=Psychrobacter aestuarii TaxID=556327 RepID=A0ABN0VWS4_9GAMM|nr:hypothetical protein [Psychrobacter aestuarii]